MSRGRKKEERKGKKERERNLDREGVARDRDMRTVAEIRAEESRVDCGTHQHHFQIGTDEERDRERNQTEKKKEDEERLQDEKGNDDDDDDTDR
jgi:hypothetical protein